MLQKHRQAKRRRVRARIHGTADRPRASVFRSVSHISVQLIDDASGKTVAAASSLKAKKGSKSEIATEVGKQLAQAAKKAGVTTVSFDRGGYAYHGRVKALAEGMREGGLTF